MVVDASAAVDLLLGTSRAIAVRRALSSVAEAHAPEMINPEVVAVIRRWTLRGWLTVPVGRRAVSSASSPSSP